jgi:hypothetical protein
MTNTHFTSEGNVLRRLACHFGKLSARNTDAGRTHAYHLVWHPQPVMAPQAR